MRLTTYLFSRLVASGVVILIIAIAWLMYTNHQRVQEQISNASNTIIRILEVQAVGPLQGIGLEPRFLDWYPVTQVSLPSGACVRFLTGDNKVRHSACHGKAERHKHVPVAFSWLYGRLFAVAKVVRRDLRVQDRQYAIEITPDADTEIAEVWSRTKVAFLLTTLVIFVLGIIAAWLINRAFVPVHAIIAALERIGRGEFDSKLVSFQFTELNQIATTCNKLAAELGNKQRQRDALFDRLQTAQEDERRLIALELHDEFGQHLTAINANALALQNTNELSTVKSDALRIHKSVKRLMDLVQALLDRLKPHPKINNSIEEMINHLIADASYPYADDLDVQFVVDGPIIECPSNIAMAIYRILQEALTNIRKHSDARNVKIAMCSSQSSIEFSITDNGTIDETTPIIPGFGLSGMRERAVSVGGQLEITRSETNGLTVRGRFPIYSEMRA